VRYKTDLKSYGGGLNVINRVQPMTYRWKSDDSRDVGFVAEAVGKIDPLLITRNEKGEVEGVKYDRLSVVFVNAFKEQQAQIQKQQEQLKRQQAQINRQEEQARQQKAASVEQQQQLNALKRLVCSSHRRAKVCK
jgi:Chaperone of endosialidase